MQTETYDSLTESVKTATFPELVRLGEELIVLARQDAQDEKEAWASLLLECSVGAQQILFQAADAAVHPAKAYLEALFEPDDILCLTFLAEGQMHVQNVFIKQRSAVTPKALARFTERNATEHVFVSMATFRTGTRQRKKENISPDGCQRVFIEADENGDAVLADVRAAAQAGEIPRPTVIVQSSPHKYQFIWRLPEPGTIEEVETVNKNLCARFKTDPAATDAARVLRLPGFRNIKAKYTDKPVVKLIEVNEQCR